MNIKIKNFQKKNPYSNSGKNKLLAALGLAASLGIAGCETTSTSGDPVMPETLSSAEVPESSSSEEPPLAGEIQMPESSSSIELIKLEPIDIYTDSPMSGIIEVYRFESSSSVSSSSSEEPPLAGG